MLRMIICWILSILMFSVLFNQSAMAHGHQDAQSVVEEYYSLIKEGELELSDKFLRYNMDKLEDYIKEHKPSKHQDFTTVIKQKEQVPEYLTEMPSPGMPLALWLDVLIGGEARYFIHEQDQMVYEIKESLQGHDLIAERDIIGILDRWHELLPAASLYYDEFVFQEYLEKYQQLDQAETREEIERTLSLSLELFHHQDNQGNPFLLDALFWTITIIGGAILFTLLYVGYRKYQAEKKKQYNRSRNS
ncbi:sporulation protein YpjB [Thalassobacillus hwangdonensis]|uniref:Sporulation protein YpjB n=1 Tax=Thalassobacillus hwangdonensis TaxID=546108 RepID=A0ABW3KX60_9BACI